MLFNSLEFGAFLAVVVLGYYGLPQRIRASWLLMWSWCFYAVWNPPYLLLFLGGQLANFVLGRYAAGSATRRVAVGAAVVLNLGVLGAYKYLAFATEELNTLMGMTGLGVDIPVLEPLLPLAISFATFQMLAYVIDVGRGELEPCKRFWEFALFISFFPQLIAGPIVRGHTLLPQLSALTRADPERITRGCYLIALGLFKKAVLADHLTVLVADTFDRPLEWGALGLLLGVYAFAFQIYLDFSGYTDIARGVGYLFNIQLPENFRSPYISRNPREFWRRWHITLSTWLRDYLYISLGGNRGRQSRVYRNLLLTMLLGGLWHGANWTFVIWGLLHGLWLIAHRIVEGRASGRAETVVGNIGRGLVTFHLVCLCWVFFRAASLDHALVILFRILTWEQGVIPDSGWLLVLGCAMFHLVEAWAASSKSLIPVLWKSPALVRGFAYTGVVLLLLLYAKPRQEFIYFQF